MKKLFLFLYFFGFSAFAFEPTWNVFGPDKREPVTSKNYPWRTIGYVGDVGCTGTLVGKKIVLTAAHCVMDANGNLRKDITYFYPNYIDGKSEHKSWIEYIWWGTNKPSDFRGSDWALLRLKEDLGSKVGWMGTEISGQNVVALAGYSGDLFGGKTATVHRDCWIRERLSNFWLHDCHTTRGASGGPMFYMKNGSPTIVALNVAEYRDDGEVSLKLSSYERKHANIAVPVSAFLSKLKEVLSND